LKVPVESLIEQLLRAGKERGYVLFEEIEASLPEGHESGAELHDLLARFAAESITVSERFPTYGDESLEYLRDAVRPQLSRVQEDALLRRIPKATTRADAAEPHRELVARSSPIVMKAAMREQFLLNLIEAGNIGLVKAVETFDYRRGFPFSTYAEWMVWANIRRAKLGIDTTGSGQGSLTTVDDTTLQD
jgi:DNA-directed RNA polymerase sigma subunit (sigma70/sigma32)